MKSDEKIIIDSLIKEGFDVTWCKESYLVSTPNYLDIICDLKITENKIMLSDINRLSFPRIHKILSQFNVTLKKNNDAASIKETKELNYLLPIIMNSLTLEERDFIDIQEFSSKRIDRISRGTGISSFRVKETLGLLILVNQRKSKIIYYFQEI